MHPVNGQHPARSPQSSPQRPVIQPPPKPSIVPKIERPFGASNRDTAASSEGSFNIHRPGRAGKSAHDRPTLPAQKGPSSEAVVEANGSAPMPSVPRPDQTSKRARAGGVSNVRIAQGWTRDREVKFEVNGLPPEWFTKEIHQAMLQLGNVTYIDIPLEHRRPSSKHAYVTFAPPPRDHRAVDNGLSAPSSLTGRTHDIALRALPRKGFGDAQLPDDAAVNAQRIDFGVMRSEETMLALHSVRSTPQERIEVSANKKQKRLDISFSVPSSLMSRMGEGPKIPAQSPYRMQINFAQISSIVQMQNENTGEVAFVLSVEAPPMVYRKTNTPLESHDDDSTRWNEWKLWYRQTEIEADLDVAKRAVKQLQRDNPIIDLGRWLTYRLTFDSRVAFSKNFRELREVLEAHGISPRTGLVIGSQFAATKAMVMWSWLDSPVAALKKSGDLSSLSDLQQMAHQTIQLPFEVRYQLESCISHGCIHECNVDQVFLEKLSATSTESEHGRERATKLLEKVVEEGRRFYDPKDIFKRVVPNMRNAFKQKAHNTHFVKVLSATVTPTTIYFNAPSLEPSNRVVRHYRQFESRFLRVHFTEEKYKGKIFGSEETQNNEIYTRFKRTMTNGIKVGDRVYEFLAFGNSQFREHGAYFFAATTDVNAAKIRHWMGDFSHICIVAKYCSRLGQCLSTTRATQNKNFKVERIPDIERNGFCFTDGVGKISPMLATLISSEVGMLTPGAGLGKDGGYPYSSAFQFRMGGCKGVLVVDPTMVAERSIAIRPSQEKFSMEKHTGLEICRISQFTNASLNVQIILVLSALGVPDDIFTDMMAAMLSDLKLAMTDENKAIELLQKNIDFSQMTVQVAQMILDGFMERQDPFMISCLRLWRSWSLKHLKEKQRILVEKGAFVLGCIDETATLEGHYDSDLDALPEIFLQIPDREREGSYKVLEGVCMLARNPSLHPGDIRIVRAVQCEKLKHIRDCVVLPQKGDRDIANMCSGGDLDGDDYMIIWDERLLPKEWNHPPMDYQAPPAIEAQGEITVNDMTSFFVTHMKYNNVGQIATLHRCWADRLDDGVKSEQCLELAALHSMAVDYAKTGQPAHLPEPLKMSARPHWTQPKKLTYHSKKVVGKLYDAVQRVDFEPVWDLPFDARILEAYELDDAILEQARAVKEVYDEAVRQVMKKYEISSEFEVWSTFVLHHHEQYNDYKFAEVMGEQTSTLKEHFQKLCHEQISADEKEQNDWTKKGPFVAAMYTITAREVEAALAECAMTKVVGGVEIPLRRKSVHTMPLMSFPWLFPTDLAWLANKRTGYASSSALGTGGARAGQQAAKTKLRQERLSEVAEPAALQELVVPEMPSDEEEEDLLGVQYIGPRLGRAPALVKSFGPLPLVSKDSVVGFSSQEATLSSHASASESVNSSSEEVRPKLSTLPGSDLRSTEPSSSAEQSARRSLDTASPVEALTASRDPTQPRNAAVGLTGTSVLPNEAMSLHLRENASENSGAQTPSGDKGDQDSGEEV